MFLNAAGKALECDWSSNKDRAPLMRVHCTGGKWRISSARPKKLERQHLLYTASCSLSFGMSRTSVKSALEVMSLSFKDCCGRYRMWARAFVSLVREGAREFRLRTCGHV